MKTLLVTGTDTDVGKTWVACLLLRALRQHGMAVGAYKPVCSGAVTGDSGQKIWPDVEQLAAAIEWTEDRDHICPQRFDAAVAPNVAASLQGNAVDDERLVSGLQGWAGVASHVVVEGAGGLLCPLSDTCSVADLAARLQSPILIIAANRLGVINHTLLTVETAINRGLTIAGVVLNDLGRQMGGNDESRESNLQQLGHWLPETNVLLCRQGAGDLESADGGDAHSLFDAFA